MRIGVYSNEATHAEKNVTLPQVFITKCFKSEASITQEHLRCSKAHASVLVLSTEMQHPLATTYYALYYPLRKLSVYSRAFGISLSNCYAYIPSARYEFLLYLPDSLVNPPTLCVSTIRVEPTQLHSSRNWFLLEAHHYQSVPTSSAPAVVFG